MVFRDRNGILFPKLFLPTVGKNCSGRRENLRQTYKKLSLYIHIPNIYFGLGFEFGPQRIWDLAMFVVRAHNHNYNRFGRPIES